MKAFTLGAFALVLVAAPASAQSIRIDGDGVVIDSGGVRIDTRGASAKAARARAKAARERAKAARERAKAARARGKAARARGKATRARAKAGAEKGGAEKRVAEKRVELRSDGVWIRSRSRGGVEEAVIEGKGFRLISRREAGARSPAVRVSGKAIDAAGRELDAAGRELDAAGRELDALFDAEGPVLRLQRVERRPGKDARVVRAPERRVEVRAGSRGVTLRARSHEGKRVRVDADGVHVTRSGGARSGRVRVDGSGVRVESSRGKRRTRVRVGAGGVRVQVD
jgi:hypothetical protein